MEFCGVDLAAGGGWDYYNTSGKMDKREKELEGMEVRWWGKNE